MAIRQRVRPSITQPLLGPGLFTPTKWDTAAEKAKFANTLLLFIQEEFPLARFTMPFYVRINRMFGMIAHNDRIGFWDEYFQDSEGKLMFLRHLTTWPSHGRADVTWSDVEMVVKERLRSAQIVGVWIAKVEAEHEAKERAQLAKLKGKYE